MVLSSGGTLQVRSLLLLPRTCVGGTSAQTLFLRNIGSAPLAGNVESISPPYEILSGGGHFVLQPGQKLAVVMGFTPVAPGTVISTLVIDRHRRESARRVCADCRGKEQPRETSARRLREAPARGRAPSRRTSLPKRRLM